MPVPSAATSVSAPTTSTATWAAMGTRVVVEVEGSPGLLDVARERLAELEARWSRFLPDSDVSRLNLTRGLPVFVHPDTRRLVRHGVAAWERTGGACDPTVLDAVVASGYDVSFEQLATRHAAPDEAPIVPGCGGIEVDDALGCVTMPPTVGFDPGAIGKGLAADLMADTLMLSGARAAFVSVGGDMRLVDAPTGSDGWRIPVAHPHEPSAPLAHLSVAGGAVATSTTERRRWRVGDDLRHHVIDPRTGRCADVDAISVTAIAGDAWWAEAHATQILLAERADWRAVVGDGAALVLDRDGVLHRLGHVERYLR